jgi:DNA-directed RNA polymerase subunit RPC12/RpoP
LVVCPKCGNKLQYRKVFFLTNLNAITCQVCSSRLRVKNKNINSVIAAVGGGLAAGFVPFFTISWALTKNVFYLGLSVTLLIIDFLVALLLIDKYVKVELETPLKL